VWIFSPEHQAAERQADDDLAAGRYTEHDTDAALVGHLEALSGTTSLTEVVNPPVDEPGRPFRP
jgi:hypothetical protein